VDLQRCPVTVRVRWLRAFLENSHPCEFYRWVKSVWLSTKVVSFNGKFRDECLNEHRFQALRQARSETAAWRRDYNDVRSHSSTGRIPPARYVEQQRLQAGDATHHSPPTQVH